MRSNTDKIDCSVFAKERGGGGHERAAGFTVNMELDKIPEYIGKELKEIFGD